MPTVTTTPALVGDGLAPKLYRTLSATVPITLVFGVGQATVLYPGTGIETRTWVVLGPVAGPVTAYTLAGTADLAVLDVAVDRGLPGIGGVSADDFDSTVQVGSSALVAESVVYAPDGTVMQTTVGGIVTAYAYDANGNVVTESRLGKTKTYNYDATGAFAYATVV